MQEFDLIVIGTGVAGGRVASRCAKDWKVAVVDSRPFGGTCSQRGCDPKRILGAAAELADRHRRLAEKGIVRGDVRLDWGSLMRFKREYTEPIPGRTERKFRDLGIAAFHGTARFTGEREIVVSSTNGTSELRGRAIVIATGMQSRSIGIDGESMLTSSDAFLDLDRLPERIVFVGAGYIGMEFAHLAARFGCDTVVLNDTGRPLEAFDADAVAALEKASAHAGIQIVNNASVVGISRIGETLSVRADTKQGRTTYVCDIAVHGAGRIPAIGGLELSAANVEHSPAGVSVDPFLRSVSNPRVWAGGDCADTGGPPLTPVASVDGSVLERNVQQALSGEQPAHRADYSGVTSAVFTVPPLAMTGMRESDAEAAGLRYRVLSGSLDHTYPIRRLNERGTFYKLLIEEESDRILGAHLFGHGMDDTINLFALAIRAGMSAREMKRTMWAYPSMGASIGYMLSS